MIWFQHSQFIKAMLLKVSRTHSQHKQFIQTSRLEVSDTLSTCTVHTGWQEELYTVSNGIKFLPYWSLHLAVVLRMVNPYLIEVCSYNGTTYRLSLHYWSLQLAMVLQMVRPYLIEACSQQWYYRWFVLTLLKPAASNGTTDSSSIPYWSLQLAMVLQMVRPYLIEACN